jgi:hypothetical protein
MHDTKTLRPAWTVSARVAALDSTPMNPASLERNEQLPARAAEIKNRVARSDELGELLPVEDARESAIALDGPRAAFHRAPLDGARTRPSSAAARRLHASHVPKGRRAERWWGDSRDLND